jgi:hypothetical protein
MGERKEKWVRILDNEKPVSYRSALGDSELCGKRPIALLDTASGGGIVWRVFAYLSWPVFKHLVVLVGVRGFEPPAPASRRQCSTSLSYTPMLGGIESGLWDEMIRRRSSFPVAADDQSNRIRVIIQGGGFKIAENQGGFCLASSGKAYLRGEIIGILNSRHWLREAVAGDRSTASRYPIARVVRSSRSQKAIAIGL